MVTTSDRSSKTLVKSGQGSHLNQECAGFKFMKSVKRWTMQDVFLYSLSSSQQNESLKQIVTVKFYHEITHSAQMIVPPMVSSPASEQFDYGNSLSDEHRLQIAICFKLQQPICKNCARIQNEIYMNQCTGDSQNTSIGAQCYMTRIDTTHVLFVHPTHCTPTLAGICARIFVLVDDIPSAASLGRRWANSTTFCRMGQTALCPVTWQKVQVNSGQLSMVSRSRKVRQQLELDFRTWLSTDQVVVNL